MSGVTRGLAAALPLLAIASLSSCPARAEPQANAALTLGVAGISQKLWWTDTTVHVGSRADVLLGRTDSRDFGVGPFVEVLSNLPDIQLGGGASVLLPVHSCLPLVLSSGGYARHASTSGWQPGVSAQLFWGSRSYNFDSAYVMAGGLMVQVRHGLGDSQERSIVLAVHVDGEALALPLLLLYEALSGPHAR